MNDGEVTDVDPAMILVQSIMYSMLYDTYYVKKLYWAYFLCPISLGRYVYTSPRPCPMPSAMIFSKYLTFL